MSNKRPKIAINLLQLAPGRVEGVVTYVKQLVEFLPLASKPGDIYIIKRRELDLGISNKDITIIDFDPPRFYDKVINKLMSTFGIQVKTARLKRFEQVLYKSKIDVIHYPLGTIPASEMKLRLNIVLTLHDIQHEYLPEIFSRLELAARKNAFRPSVDRADKIIAISRFTKDSLVEKFNTPKKKIDVVYNAGGVSKSSGTSLSLPQDFMYYPAGDWPHKNHILLLSAIAKLRSEGRKTTLVMTGLRTTKLQAVQDEIFRLDLKDCVIDLGQVSFDQVGEIYRRARMLIFPTLFEGFGIPALEAMSVGLPVACSNTTSLPEIVGDAAETFNPESVDEIAAAIKKVWSDDDYRATLIKRGYKQAAKFSWEKTAKQTYDVYKEVYEQNK